MRTFKCMLHCLKARTLFQWWSDDDNYDDDDDDDDDNDDDFCCHWCWWIIVVEDVTKTVLNTFTCYIIHKKNVEISYQTFDVINLDALLSHDMSVKVEENKTTLIFSFIYSYKSQLVYIIQVFSVHFFCF